MSKKDRTITIFDTFYYHSVPNKARPQKTNSNNNGYLTVVEPLVYYQPTSKTNNGIRVHANTRLHLANNRRSKTIYNRYCITNVIHLFICLYIQLFSWLLFVTI